MLPKTFAIDYQIQNSVRFKYNQENIFFPDFCYISGIISLCSCLQHLLAYTEIYKSACKI